MAGSRSHEPFPARRGAVRSRVEASIADGTLSRDPVQTNLADRLDAIEVTLRERAPAAKSSALGWLFGKRAAAEAPRGLYIHGKVGRGKSMLMDLFFEASGEPAKRRVHFHAFMADVHVRIGQHREAVKEGRASGDDPMPPVAAAIAAEARLLCFDEFAVTDIADAMILSRLFEALFARGSVLVATSNVAPGDLYRDGLNRPLFLPFVDLLKSRCDIVELDGGTDYRMEALDLENLYLSPLDGRAKEAVDGLWRSILAGSAEAPTAIRRLGRDIAVPRAGNGAARLKASDLLSRPLGAADFLALADAFHTLVIEDVPVLDLAERNEAKRLIALVDALYDARRRLVVSAAAPADSLYRGKTGTERFEFDRTISRLNEMRSAQYIEEAKAKASKTA